MNKVCFIFVLVFDVCIKCENWIGCGNFVWLNVVFILKIYLLKMNYLIIWLIIC